MKMTARVKETGELFHFDATDRYGFRHGDPIEVNGVLCTVVWPWPRRIRLYAYVAWRALWRPVFWLYYLVGDRLDPNP